MFSVANSVATVPKLFSFFPPMFSKCGLIKFCASIYLMGSSFCENNRHYSSFSFRSVMGSFSSAPKYENEDNQDKDILLPKEMSVQKLLDYCARNLSNTPMLLRRSFMQVIEPSERNPENKSVRVMQWNVLSQALGVNNDRFVRCPAEGLNWSRRRFQILQEIITHSPDIICLQEVDHFDFLSRTLSTVDYEGIFCPKPDSPCIYIKDNNGPDGCAIFYSKRFELLSVQTRILEVWKIESNQVAILLNLKEIESGVELCIVCTHLKARKGALLSSLRNEQGKDLLEFIRRYNEKRPVIMCGDFNAEPDEAVYRTVSSDNELFNLRSAYRMDGKEPAYTTWKVREEGEIKHTIDYIFYTGSFFEVNALLQFPTEEEIGEDRVPSLSYPSDHFSLVCDLSYKGLSQE